MSDSDSDNKIRFKSKYARQVLFYIENEYEIVVENLSVETQKIVLKLLKEMKKGGHNVPNAAHYIAYNIPL